MHAQRRLLPEASNATIELHGLKGLIRETNDFIDRHKLYATENTGYSKQIEAMLRAVQEVVVIFDGDRVIEFANTAAEQLFNSARTMKGLRVDAAMRSLELLEFLENKDTDSTNGNQQISIEREGSVLWFEASCTQVRGIAEPKLMSSLMVLHDITRLKSLEVMRREFVANVSHELRTPLTIIKGFAETLVDDYEVLPIEMRARYLAKILKNAERLNVLVEDLLTISRLESKRDQFEPKLQGLLPVFEDVAEDYLPKLEKHQSIVIDIDPEVPEFEFDRFRINQVLDNLVVNALRYASKFNQITISARLDTVANTVICSVKDDGVGIPEEDLSHIFERFYRVDKGRSVKRGGTGLGLSIVKHIVQLHGGTVYAESCEGEWTEVSFCLPLETCPEGS